MAPVEATNAAETAAGDAVAITAVNGMLLAGGQGPGSIADITVRKLRTLQGTMKPSEISSLESYPGTDNTVAAPPHSDSIRVEFAPLDGQARVAGAPAARAAGTFDTGITPGQWVQLIARWARSSTRRLAVDPRRRRSPIARARLLDRLCSR